MLWSIELDKFYFINCRLRVQCLDAVSPWILRDLSERWVTEGTECDIREQSIKFLEEHAHPFRSILFLQGRGRSATTRPASGRGRRGSRRPTASDLAFRDFIPLYPNQPRVIETFTRCRRAVRSYSLSSSYFFFSFFYSKRKRHTVFYGIILF